MAGNEHLCTPFFPHNSRPFHLSTENVRASSDRNGHQNAYSCADTINNNKNNTSNVFHDWKFF